MSRVLVMSGGRVVAGVLAMTCMCVMIRLTFVSRVIFHHEDFGRCDAMSAARWCAMYSSRDCISPLSSTMASLSIKQQHPHFDHDDVLIVPH